MSRDKFEVEEYESGIDGMNARNPFLKALLKTPIDYWNFERGLWRSGLGYSRVEARRNLVWVGSSMEEKLSRGGLDPHDITSYFAFGRDPREADKIDRKVGQEQWKYRDKVRNKYKKARKRHNIREGIIGSILPISPGTLCINNEKVDMEEVAITCTSNERGVFKNGLDRCRYFMDKDYYENSVNHRSRDKVTRELTIHPDRRCLVSARWRGY